MNQEPFYIVALGASAGGYQALWDFFSNIPLKPGIAFVVIQHLKRDMVSIADKLLSKYTPLPITWATEQQLVEPNHIYMLPAGKYMTIQDGKLQLINRDPQDRLNRAVDIFLTSLAQQQDGHSIGIILSGAGFDGVQGANQVYKSGGLMMVQAPATAEFSSMPRWVMLEDHPQLALSPNDLAIALIDLIQRKTNSLSSHNVGCNYQSGPTIK